MLFNLIVFAVLIKALKTELCPKPKITNGKAKGDNSGNSYIGTVICDLGYHLVGSSSKIKCRDGQWSVDPLPACAAVGSCLELEQIENGRNVPIHGSRQSAFKFKCRKGFKLYGVKRTYCEGDSWSYDSMPVCTARGCDMAGMLDIPYGEGRALLGGGVYRYRCNVGVDMRGHDTVYCNGEYWNGTIPTCLVAPGKPELSLSVSGIPEAHFKTGDLLDVSCEAVSGNPVPEVGISWPGQKGREVQWKRLSDSITLALTTEEDGKKIECIAQNTAGTSHTFTILNIMSPPTSVQLSGPLAVQRQSEFVYECKVEGGKPRPDVRWTISDQLGNTREVEDDMTGGEVTRMILKPQDKESLLKITCTAVNLVGSASHSINVHSYYLPKSVQINGPETLSTRGSIQFVCSSMSSFPTPTIKWRVEKVGNITEVEDVVGAVTTEVMEDQSIIAVSTLNVTFNPSVKYVKAECRAVIKNLGEIESAFHIAKARYVLETPKIYGLGNLSTCREGHVVSLTCSVDFSEDLEYLSWFVDGELQGEDHHLDKADGHMVSRWDYVPGLGETEIMCQVNGREEHSCKIAFIVEGPIEIVQLESKDIFDDYSDFWVTHKSATNDESPVENEDFQAVKQIFMEIVDKVGENIQEEFRKSEKQPSSRIFNLKSIQEPKSLESDKQEPIMKSPSQKKSLSLLSAVVLSIMLSAL